MGHRAAVANPYSSSIRDPEAAAFDNGEFRVDGSSIIGGDTIRLPEVCAFTGSTEQLASQTSVLWRFSITAWLPFLLAWTVLILHAFSYGWRNGPAQSAPLDNQAVPWFFSWINARSATALIFVAAFVSFILQRKTRVTWYLPESEARVRRQYKSMVISAAIVLVIAGYIYRPVAGWMAFLLLFHLFYSNRRFPRLRLLERRKNFSRVGGLSPKFLEIVERSKLALGNKGDDEKIGNDG